MEELRQILTMEGGEVRSVPVVDVGEGYRRWATTYDDPGNALIMAEQPAVWEVLDAVGAGSAIDAACGTGRHTRHLVELGHRVTGIDQSSAMLARARRRVPEAAFEHADLRAVPADDDSFDLALCALALEHFADLTEPLVELARVVRSGGSVVLSESHPALRAIGGGPFFRDATGASGVVRTHPHLYSDYLEAFVAAGLDVRHCREVRFGPQEVALQAPTADLYPEAATGAFLGFPAVIVWDLVVRP
jgi:ubiquinone/menaquinone biosynthesis C-methylase UbiE